MLTLTGDSFEPSAFAKATARRGAREHTAGVLVVRGEWNFRISPDRELYSPRGPSLRSLSTRRLLRVSVEEIGVGASCNSTCRDGDIVGECSGAQTNEACQRNGELFGRVCRIVCSMRSRFAYFHRPSVAAINVLSPRTLEKMEGLSDHFQAGVCETPDWLLSAFRRKQPNVRIASVRALNAGFADGCDDSGGLTRTRGGEFLIDGVHKLRAMLCFGQIGNGLTRDMKKEFRGPSAASNAASSVRNNEHDSVLTLQNFGAILQFRIAAFQMQRCFGVQATKF